MKIAILGYGTVGKGLVQMIEGNKKKYKSSKYVSLCRFRI